MSAFSYDLHIHSCLSPCGDGDMTPNNLVGMAKVKGLDVIALTDHNSCRNCAAAMEAGERLGVLVLPGMELCTSEDIHVVCLFRELSGALAFAQEVYPLLPDIRNRPDIFGEQTVMDGEDRVTGTEPRFLLNAADLGVNRVAGAVRAHGGAAFPAHVDKPSNGIYGVLGGIPPEAGFTAAELSAACGEPEFCSEHPELGRLALLHNSDAHYLWQISERNHFLHLPELTADAIITRIENKNYEIL